MDFLTHFKLPIRYEIGTYLLTSLRQTTYTHISDHIHEWRRRRRLIKAPILDQLLAEWFTNYFCPSIARDVVMGGAVTKEKAIGYAQYLDLVYSQSGTLYDMIPHVSRPTTDPLRLSTEPPADGILGLVQTQTTDKSSKKQATTLSNQQAPPAKTTFPPVASAEVNAVQSTESSGRKKKGKNKSKKPDNQ